MTQDMRADQGFPADLGREATAATSVALASLASWASQAVMARKAAREPLATVGVMACQVCQAPGDHLVMGVLMACQGHRDSQDDVARLETRLPPALRPDQEAISSPATPRVCALLCVHMAPTSCGKDTPSYMSWATIALMDKTLVRREAA